MKKIGRVLKILTAAILILILAVSAFLIFLQYKLLYYPHYNSESNSYLARSSGDELEEVFIDTDFGKCHGWVHKSSEDSDTILFFGGNGQTSDEWFETLNVRHKWESFGDYNYVMFDYPGYSTSDGKPGKDDVLLMADKAYEYVSESKYLGNKKIYVIGYSIGTGPATYVASKHDVQKLALLAPYSNMTDEFNTKINIFYGPVKILNRNNYESDKYAENVKNPVLIVASKKDEVIPYRLSEKLKGHFSNVTFETLDGKSHNDVVSDTKTLEYISDFLSF